MDVGRRDSKEKGQNGNFNEGKKPRLRAQPVFVVTDDSWQDTHYNKRSEKGQGEKENVHSGGCLGRVKGSRAQ